MRVHRGGIAAANRTVMRCATFLSSPLQGVEYALAQQRKACSAITHALYQFQLGDLSFDDSIALWQSQARFHCRFISFDPQNKAVEAANVAGSDFLQPGVELASCARAQYLGELLHEIIGEINLRVQIPQRGERFLLIQSQVFGPTKEEKGRFSGKHRSPPLDGAFDTGFARTWEKTQQHDTHTRIRSLVALLNGFEVRLLLNKKQY